MYLHLGTDVIIRTRDILGIFDLDTSTISRRTRDYLRKGEIEGRVVYVTSELPKSFIVTANGQRTTIYISKISASTLNKRSGYIDGIKNI